MNEIKNLEYANLFYVGIEMIESKWLHYGIPRILLSKKLCLQKILKKLRNENNIIVY